MGRLNFKRHRSQQEGGEVRPVRIVRMAERRCFGGSPSRPNVVGSRHGGHRCDRAARLLLAMIFVPRRTSVRPFILPFMSSFLWSLLWSLLAYLGRLRCGSRRRTG